MLLCSKDLDTLEKIIWCGLGNRFDLFVDMKGNFLPQFQDSHLVSTLAVDSAMLDQIFNLKFASGVEVTAKLQEDNLIASFYNEKVIYECLGKEMCISLDDTEIANLYIDGNKKLGIAKHRLPRLFDERGRGLRRHDVSKAVDRLRTTEKPRCPHIIQADQ